MDFIQKIELSNLLDFNGLSRFSTIFKNHKKSNFFLGFLPFVSRPLPFALSGSISISVTVLKAVR